MAGINDLIQKAKMFFTSVSLIQKYKVNIFENRSSEESERHQDYGFASQPSEGEGLVIDAGGSVVVLRIDRLKERPTLANDEVAVWHKDGAKIHLKAARIIEIDCDVFALKASSGAHFDTPIITTSGNISAAQDIIAAGISQVDHRHPENGEGSLTDPPV